MLDQQEHLKMHTINSYFINLDNTDGDHHETTSYYLPSSGVNYEKSFKKKKSLNGKITRFSKKAIPSDQLLLKEAPVLEIIISRDLDKVPYSQFLYQVFLISKDLHPHILLGECSPSSITVDEANQVFNDELASITTPDQATLMKEDQNFTQHILLMLKIVNNCLLIGKRTLLLFNKIHGYSWSYTNPNASINLTIHAMYNVHYYQLELRSTAIKKDREIRVLNALPTDLAAYYDQESQNYDPNEEMDALLALINIHFNRDRFTNLDYKQLLC